MEPVPETERMEEFRPSPIPRAHVSSPHAFPSFDMDVTRKPPNMRRSTDPSPASPSGFSWGTMAALPYRPRTASPLSGTHTRSKSVASLGAPSMSRTQSMPGLNGAGHVFFSPQLRPASPLSSPSRVRTPRKPVDEAFPLTTPMRNSVLDQDGPPTSRSSSPILGPSATAAAAAAAAANRVRRPSSPLRNLAHASTGSLSTLPITTSASTSSLYKAYDPFSSGYSSYSSGALSSVPSTPTSTRSRSPSISSLETIPDSPDAEEAALEAEKAAQLKAAAEMSDSSDSSSDGKGRSSLDALNRGRTMTYGSREKRKRWSVCGAERRGDLDLETIWED